MNLPSMATIRQRFDSNPISDISGTIAEEFRRNQVSARIRPGQQVAITAGSRGINNISEITGAIVKQLKDLGATPFIVPAMGSHGGATAQGQSDLLAHLGISESTLGVPVKSSMDVVSVGTTDDGVPVFIDKNAHGADHIIVVNRIKQHTDFVGIHESGLLKMLAIGLGKQKAADLYHCLFLEHGHFKVLTSAAKLIIEKYPVTFGIGIVEDQCEATAIIEMFPRERIVEQEKKLLIKAKALLPTLPFDSLDLLIVDEMGKTFSGTGMDQNVIGRSVASYHVVPDHPKISRIFVRNLAEDSGGNATGLGNADFTTSRLVSGINRHYSYMNSFTASSPELIRIPPYFDTDRECLEACISTLPFQARKEPRIVHIRNTLDLETIAVSENMLSEVKERGDLDQLSDPVPFSFDETGNIGVGSPIK